MASMAPFGKSLIDLPGGAMLVWAPRRRLDGGAEAGEDGPTGMLENRRRGWRVGLGLSLAVAAFVFLFLTRSRQQYGDGLTYLKPVETGIDVFHPHHLGYNPSVRGVFAGLRAVGIPVDLITAAQVFNILCAVAALFAAYGLARRMTGSRAWGLGSALGLLVCQGFWEYATQSQVYVPAMAALGWTACFAAARVGRRWSWPSVAGLAGLLILSVLFHQTAVLFVLPLAILVLPAADRASRLRLVAGALAAALVIVGLYAAAFLARGEPFTLSELLRYALHYAYHPAPDWGTWSNIGPAGIAYALFSLLRNILPVVGWWQKIAVAAFGLFLAGLGAWHIRRSASKAGDGAKRLRIFLLAWLGVHGFFYLWWAPQDKNNFTVALLPLVLLLASAVSEATAGWTAVRRRAGASVGILLLLALGAVNWTLFIRPLHLTRGPNYDEAAALDACVPAGDWILSAQDVQAHLAYYFGRRNLLQVEILPMCFAQGLPLTEDYRVLRDRPVVLSPSYLDPGSKLSMVTGFERPGGWRDWLAWMFGLETDAAGTVVSGRTFEILACPQGYLRIGTDRTALSGWSDFLARLDGLLAPSLGGRPRVFRNWAEATRLRLDP